MLARSISQYQDIEASSDLVFFDRGVADNISYAILYGLSFEHGWTAAERYRANSKVFFAPNWRGIYTTDEERTMAFEASAGMGDDLRMIYSKLGYEIIDLPLLSPEQRVAFMLDRLRGNPTSPC
jgi:predicted ATPase